MKDTEIIEALRTRLAQATGRHLYGILGDYRQLDAFATRLHKEARMPDGHKFPVPVNVNQGILKSIPDDKFRILVENEAKRPEPTQAHVAKAFEAFLRDKLRSRNLLVLAHFEMLFAYHLELNLLRTLATDDDRILLLLPGKRSSGKVIMFPDWEEGDYVLPTNLIADNHLWELRE